MNDESPATSDDEATGSGSPERLLARHSDRLLEAVDRVRTLEVEKRTEVVSTPEFHRLADAVERESRRVFSLAEEEEELGDRPDAGGFTIDEVAESRDRTDA
jgi:hypothetical protein